MKGGIAGIALKWLLAGARARVRRKKEICSMAQLPILWGVREHQTTVRAAGGVKPSQVQTPRDPGTM